MRPFKSFLADEMAAYLQYRKSIGYKRMPGHSYLLAFDDYLLKTKADRHSFTPSFFLEMRAELKSKHDLSMLFFHRYEASLIFLPVAVTWTITPSKIFRR